MNADLKRVRDTFPDDGGPSSSKRRALGTGSTSSPPLSSADDNGGDDAAADEDEQLEDWMRVVETKRKEAIFRQMLDYRRSYDRERARAEMLEKQRRALEASVHGVEACWAQLVASVREKAKIPDELVQAELLDSTVDLSKPQSELDSSLQLKLAATLRLIAVFSNLASSNGLRSDVGGDLQQQVARLQAEASALRANSTLLQSQIDQLGQARDTYQRDLQRAEKKIVRQRMEHDKDRDEWRTLRESMSAGVGKVAAGAAAAANGSGHSTPNANGQPEDVKPAVTGVEGAVNPSEMLQNTAELEQLAQSRLEQLQALWAERATLAQEVDRLKLLAHHPSESALRESPFFQVYLHQLTAHVTRGNAMQARFEMSEQKLDQLRDSNLDFRDAVLAEARTETESLRQQVSKRDADLARLRGQRDEMNAELLERRAREAEKSRFAEEVESLAKARQERIAFLTSEVRRLKGKLAAGAGAEGYLSFLASEGGIDGDFVKDLETQLASARERIVALESTVIGDEAAIRIELETVKGKLAKYERVLGPDAAVGEDVKQLADQLQQTTDAKAKLELQLGEAEESTNALYAEVEGLSKLWEGLEQTLRTKVFDLKDGELKMARLNTEKAKADNKYFQAMRAKEAVEAECKTAQRSVEKQLKLIERAQEVERALTAQIVQQEKGIIAMKNAGLELQTQLAAISSEKTQLELRLQQSQATLAEAQQLAHLRTAEAGADKEARAKVQEELDSTQRSLKKLKEKQEAMTAATSSSNMSASEYQTKEERDKLWKLLRCSCCEQNFKQQVITKCMHTFCKGCLDSRIASRQRKCPACGLAFAKEDCQTLYWQ